MLAGCVLLLTARKQMLRLVSCLAVVGGVGLLGMVSGLWLILLFAVIAILLLLYFFFRARSSEVCTKDSEAEVGLSLNVRTVVAGIVAAGVAGIFIGVIWTNPVWNQSQTPHSIAISSMQGGELAQLAPFVLLPLILGLLFVQRKRSDDSSEEFLSEHVDGH